MWFLSYSVVFWHTLRSCAASAAHELASKLQQLQRCEPLQHGKKCACGDIAKLNESIDAAEGLHLCMRVSWTIDKRSASERMKVAKMLQLPIVIASCTHLLFANTPSCRANSPYSTSDTISFSSFFVVLPSHVVRKCARSNPCKV